MEITNSALSQAMMGNQNRNPARPFSDTLRTALFTDSRKRMNQVVQALIAKAEDGDVPAIKELADRLEGKVITQVNVNTTNFTIDADLLTAAGALLDRLGTTLPAPLQCVDPGVLQDVIDAEIVEDASPQV
jgi:hypothetical protein